MARPLTILALCALLTSRVGAAPASSDPYEALRAKDYDSAIERFLAALKANPGHTGWRKDLGYTYLKTGDTEAARDQFAAAMRLDPSDQHVALEYAFLCYETRRQAEARRIFDRIRKSGNATAEQAFLNIDGPLAEGIARWAEVVARSPDNFSAHRELARLAEQRDQLDLATTHYTAAWRLRPAERSLLLDLGRVWTALGRSADAHAALLAASRGSRPRVAEEARERLPPRYPWASEFRSALELDPGNTALRRELGFLLLEMGRRDEAETEFRNLVDSAPDDVLAAAQLGFLLLARGDRIAATPLLEKALRSPDPDLVARVRAALKMPPDPRRPPTPPDKVPPAPAAQLGAKEMGERSYRSGYLKDALKYFTAAHDSDPVDFAVMLKLGWTYNQLRRDDLAIRWFELARKSPDRSISAEAARAYRNLRPALARFRTTAWLTPFYSSRWRDVFSYGQVKTEIRLGSLPVRPYLSVRFIGDLRETTGEAAPQYLSESAFLLAGGLVTRSWHGLLAWAEAGKAVGYRDRPDQARITADYRGGVAFSRGAGQPLSGEAPGLFAESSNDGVFVSRFANDVILYSQNRSGYTLPRLAGLRSQVFVGGNLVADLRRQYWANFVEFGPGVRFRWEGLPPSLVFSVSVMRGVYTRNEGNPRRPNFFDLRAGFWYAGTW